MEHTGLQLSFSTHKSFTKFAHLAPEIQQMIWASCIVKPRLVVVHYNSRTANSQESGAAALRRDFLSFRVHHGQTSPPKKAAFSELRAIQPHIDTISIRLAGSSSCPHVFFFTEQEDVLYFPSKDASLCGPINFLPSFINFFNTLHVLDPQQLLKVGRLAVHMGLFLDTLNYPNDSENVLRHLEIFWSTVKAKFRNVKDVLVCENEEAAAEWIDKKGWEDEKPVSRVLLEQSNCPNYQMLSLISNGTVEGMKAEDPGWAAPRWRVWGRSCSGCRHTSGGLYDRVLEGRKVYRAGS